MANIKVLGSTAIVNTSLTLDDIKLLQRERPEALTLYEGEGENKEPVFSVTVSRSRRGDLTRYGAEFPRTANATGNPVITLELPEIEEPTSEKLKEAVISKVGKGILYLSKLEATIPDIADEVRSEMDEIGMYISIL